MTAVAAVTRVLAIPVFLVLAVVGQLAVVNRVPLPGGVAPDLVLLVVTAAAVTRGPMAGTLAGFAGGLALDVAPPGGHLAGEYALIFCLVGYLCGRVMMAVEEATGERSAVTALTVMALGVAAGEAGKAALGRMVSDPSVTMPAIKHVLPGAIIYDLLLCPFVLWLVSVAVRRPAPEAAPGPVFSQAQRMAGAFRLASTGAAPRLRLAGSTPPLVPPPVRAEPKLRLAGISSPALSRTNVAFSPGRTALPGGRMVKLNFAGNGRGNSLNGASALRAPQLLPGKAPGKGWLRPEKPAGTAAPRRGAPPKGWLRGSRTAAVATAPERRSPGRGWLRAESPRPAAATVIRRTSPPKGWLRGDRTAAVASVPQRRSPGRGWLRAESPRPAAAAAVRRTSPPKGWLRAERLMAASALHRRSPGKGWLRPEKPAPAPHRRSPGKGWLRPEKPAPTPRLKSPGKGWLRPARPVKSNWYTRGPSGRWLRRGRGPWRGRRRRLPQSVGGRR